MQALAPLDRIAATRNYPPIVDAANAALEEVRKIAEKLQPPPAAMPAAGGQPLARITPVKRSAAELAEQAAAKAAPPAPAPAQPPQQIAPPRPSGRRAIAPGGSRPPPISTGVNRA